MCLPFCCCCGGEDDQGHGVPAQQGATAILGTNDYRRDGDETKFNNGGSVAGNAMSKNGGYQKGGVGAPNDLVRIKSPHHPAIDSSTLPAQETPPDHRHQNNKIDSSTPGLRVPELRGQKIASPTPAVEYPKKSGMPTLPEKAPDYWTVPAAEAPPKEKISAGPVHNRPPIDAVRAPPVPQKADRHKVDGYQTAGATVPAPAARNVHEDGSGQHAYDSKDYRKPQGKS